MQAWLRWSIWLVVGVLALGLVLRFVVFDIFVVPDEPLEARSWANAPTLEPGDVVLTLRLGTQRTGDLVRCSDPTMPQKWLVARIAGMAGDRIEVQDDGLLRINVHRLTAQACTNNGRKVQLPDGTVLDLLCTNEELGGAHHDVGFLPGAVMAHPEQIVSRDRLFLMSDNRTFPFAHDSRVVEVGQVEARSCDQRLVLRLWSKYGWSDAARRLVWLF